MVTPRYLMESTEAREEELMVMCTCGLEWHLEITRRELFVGLIARPEDAIQLGNSSTST